MGKAKADTEDASGDDVADVKRGGNGANRRLLAVLEQVPADGQWYLIDRYDSVDGGRRARDRYRSGRGWLPEPTTTHDWEFDQTCSRHGGNGITGKSSKFWARRLR